MTKVRKYTVVPQLPEKLHQLMDIAYNLWWSWNPDAIDLFFRVDRDLWIDCEQNPVLLLGRVSQSRLEELAEDSGFLSHMERVSDRLDKYMQEDPWRVNNPHAPEPFQVAYFSAEYGLHESVRIYSGGLGVLSGDHLKAASDLGLPLAGVGLLYREGYFSQYLNAEGWQQETYPRNDFHNLPLTLVTDKKDKPLVIEAPYPGRLVKAYIWRCQVGRVPLYLLDCDHEDNTPEDRGITGQLYGGDRDTRIRQEIMLGMGGILALHALGVEPTVYHMNEGHSAFLALQRIQELVQREGLSFDQAIETVRAGTHFTTHTPVPAGNDMFDPGMIDFYFKQYCEAVNIPLHHLLGMGRQNPVDEKEPFCMTVLALKLSSGSNGVSKLHGEVARNMWQLTWKGIPEDEVPITSITNGVHTRSYISRDLSELYDRYLGPGWINNPDDQSIWERVDEIPDNELWRMKERRRERLVNFSRKRLHQQIASRSGTSVELREAIEVLYPEALTIGFARRFATYKRATLILRDPERLRRILLDSKRPVQFIIAGKAHPQDAAGKQLIRDLLHFARDPQVRNHFVFIEDYNINVARYLVQGVDCWLNTPRRPMEASGTSGMKSSANGGLNISIPDGWWCEAEHLGPNGWSIGRGESYDAIEEQDEIESQAFYDLLEHEIVPMFYDRGRDGIPREWIQRMKSAIRTIVPVFNTYRMVQEYADRGYIPCSKRRAALMADERKRALALAAWKERVRTAWEQVRVLDIDSEDSVKIPVGGKLQVKARIDLGVLSNDDVIVEIFYGGLSPQGDLAVGNTVQMHFNKQVSNGESLYEGAIDCEKTGQQGFTVRVLPSHPDLAEKHETGLIAWA